MKRIILGVAVLAGAGLLMATDPPYDCDKGPPNCRNPNEDCTNLYLSSPPYNWIACTESDEDTPGCIIFEWLDDNLDGCACTLGTC